MGIMEDIKMIDEIVGHLKRKYGKNFIRGTMECPKCKGTLRFIIHSLNGHVHGCCETENCLNWME